MNAEFVTALNAQSHMVDLVATGGGIALIQYLLSVGGASRTLIEASVPYAMPALEAFCETKLENFVHEDTASLMARKAFERALVRKPEDAEVPIAGVAITAALATDRPKRGPHRAHIALCDGTTERVWSIELDKGARSRTEEDEHVSTIAFNLIAEWAGIPTIPITPRPADIFQKRDPICPALRALSAAQEGQTAPRWACLMPDGSWFVEGQREVPVGIFAGSFNPFHDGHKALYACVKRRCPQGTVAYELTVENPDKGNLAEAEVIRRARQFRGVAPLVLSRAARFYDKIHDYRGGSYAVGYDTAARLIDPKYYSEPIQDVLANMKRLGATLYVVPRVVDGVCLELVSLALPAGTPEGLFEAVPLSENPFPGMSSTALRNKTD